MKAPPVRPTAMLAICAGLLLAAVPLQSQAHPGGGGSPGGSAGAGHGGGSYGGSHYGGGHHGGYYGGHYGGHWGGYWGGYWGPGAFWGGVALGYGLGCYGYYGYYGYCGGGYYPAPGYVVAPPYGEYVTVDPPGAPVVRSTQPVPAAAPMPDPIFYPRNGQTPAQAENDRQECNRWATTQQGAMSDASIFQRATLACMEGRGYTVR